MTEERARRKLSGILSADAVGYSRLMRQDEGATVATLKEYKEMMALFINNFHGRVVDSPGDNILAEFGSVVDVVECAVEIQNELKDRNEALADDRKMEFRIGIHLGDVLEEEDRIYGDGVNIAARIEGLAESGGICISRTAYDSIKDKLSFGYEYLGEHSVKNIAEPVRVYRVLIEPEAAGKVIGEKRFLGRVSRRTAMAVIIGLVIVAGGLIGWNIYLQQSKEVEPASLEKLAYPLPDKPSIAVLPFDNMSADPEQEYFSDGITEEIITALSKVSDIFVIARNSTFVYKGKPVNIKQVSEELGVRYVIEGSVRKDGDKLRITAQLIDAIKGHHLWAQRYDGKMGDVFALQDKVTRKIVAALAVKLTAGEKDHIARMETNNIESYDAFLQGWSHYVLRTPTDFAKAERYFKKAIELDPKYGRALAALASTYWESTHNFWHSSLGVKWGTARYLAEEYLEKAMEYPTTLAHQVATKMYVDWQEYEKAIAEAERAVNADPNDPNSYIAMAYALVYDGRSKEAVDFINRAMRLDPQYPAFYLFILGLSQFSTDQFQKAANSFERALKRNPENYVPLIPLSAAYAHLGAQHEAELSIARLKKALPMMTVSIVMGCPLWRYKDFEDKDRLLIGLRKAGLT